MRVVVTEYSGTPFVEDVLYYHQPNAALLIVSASRKDWEVFVSTCYNGDGTVSLEAMFVVSPLSDKAVLLAVLSVIPENDEDTAVIDDWRSFYDECVGGSEWPVWFVAPFGGDKQRLLYEKKEPD